MVSILCDFCLLSKCDPYSKYEFALTLKVEKWGVWSNIAIDTIGNSHGRTLHIFLELFNFEIFISPLELFISSHVCFQKDENWLTMIISVVEMSE